MKKTKQQEVYINLDDSGKLTNKEKISVYGGIVFISKKEKDKFLTQYRSIIKSIKCNYCEHRDKCNNRCPEIKNTNIQPNDKRRIMNYIKKYYVIGVIIHNNDVYDYIKTNKSARGRFNDYALRRLIKNTIKKLIKNKKIDPNQSLKLVINIDEQSTKSNGYYKLYDGILEELTEGIINYNYSIKYKPLLSNLELYLTYQDSGKNYLIQAADLIAGTIRKMSIDKDDIDGFVDLSLNLPKNEKEP